MKIFLFALAWTRAVIGKMLKERIRYYRDLNNLRMRGQTLLQDVAFLCCADVFLYLFFS